VAKARANNESINPQVLVNSANNNKVSMIEFKKTSLLLLLLIPVLMLAHDSAVDEQGGHFNHKDNTSYLGQS
jgi:hypothetical protein